MPEVAGNTSAHVIQLLTIGETMTVIDAVRWDELRKEVERMVGVCNEVQDFESADAYDKVLYFMNEAEKKQAIADIEREIEKEKLKLQEYWPTDLIDDLVVLHGLPTSRKAILIRIDSLRNQIEGIKTGDIPI